MLVDGHGAGHAGTRGCGDGVAALLVTLRLPLMGLHGGRSDPSLAPTHPGNYNNNNNNNNNNNIGPDYQNTIRVLREYGLNLMVSKIPCNLFCK